jgi:drug/metabolite transporter (DMT)-like permease
VILIRAFAELASTMLFLNALAQMPLANVSAILQSLPLTVTMFAAMFFGEAVGWRRWSAILVGFIGVLIIIRPGSDGFNEYAVLALIAVGFITLRDAITRRLDRSVPSLFVAFVSAIPVFLFGGAMTVTTGWTPVSWSMGIIVTVAAISITCGYLFAVMAMRSGDVSFVAPFRYTGMIWAILFGFLLFGNLPDQMTILGTCIVIGMGVYAFHRERVRQKAIAT